MITLVLGGARSGKSHHAEQLALARPGPRLYLATAESRDHEMAERIRLHRERRAALWTTLEEPLALPDALRRHAAVSESTILVDCLTLWLSNLLEAGHDIDATTRDLTDACDSVRGSVIFVSNEVGLGIVPDNALARSFRDHAGRLNQAVAARADRVLFVAAGLALSLK
ncbi:MAG: bifunctional adenosylcobinamide kinase/adenosylcobinamide-phosphate guanylyltransferase [Rhodospirillaceae bacterium]